MVIWQLHQEATAPGSQGASLHSLQVTGGGTKPPGGGHVLGEVCDKGEGLPDSVAWGAVHWLKGEARQKHTKPWKVQSPRRAPSPFSIPPVFE